MGVDSALGALPRSASKGDVSGDDVSKEALAAALKRELARSGDQSSSPNGRRKSSGGGSQASSKPPSAGSSKASSPKVLKPVSIFRGAAESGEEQGGAWATEEGFRGSVRSSDDGAAFRVASRLSPSGTPNLSRQSSAKAGAYSRQSSLGSASVKGEGEGGIRLLPRVSSGFNPFLTDAFAEVSISSSVVSSCAVQ